MEAVVTVQDLRDRALLKANHVRSTRRRILNEMFSLPPAASHRRAIELLEDLPDEFETLRLGTFLTAIARNRKMRGKYGYRRTSQYGVEVLRLIKLVMATDLTRLGDLSMRQRSVLLMALRLRAEERER